MQEQEFETTAESLVYLDNKIKKINDRIEMFERIYARVMDLYLRIENIEFHSDVNPSNPAIIRLADLELKISELDSFLPKLNHIKNNLVKINENLCATYERISTIEYKLGIKIYDDGPSFKLFGEE